MLINDFCFQVQNPAKPVASMFCWTLYKQNFTGIGIPHFPLYTFWRADCAVQADLELLLPDPFFLNFGIHWQYADNFRK